MDVATSSFPRYLCYSCHTTLTSKSSRSTTTLTPGSSTTTSAQYLPTWAEARLAFGMGDEQSTDLLATTPADEIWETKKLDPDDMKSLVGEFILDQ